MQLDQLLDLERPEHLDFLRDVQANILKFHGRDHSALVFLTVDPASAAAARAWIAAEAAANVTTAATQLETSAQYRMTDADGGVVETLSISPPGYARLGVPAARIPSEPRWRYGMKGVRTSRPGIPFKDIPLHDPPFGDWEPPFQQSLDLLVTLASDDRGEAEAAVARVLGEVGGFTTASHVEWGDTLYRGGDKIEHFGYVDGISSPVFVKQDVEREVANRGAEKWDPAAHLDVVLAPDCQGAPTYGSYLVVRKLEQNVARFEAMLAELAATLRGDVEEVAGLIAGRRRDGTPVVPHYTPPAEGDYANDFQFDQDPLGMVCPFHAHIRKVNPRGDIPRADQWQAPEEDLVGFERRRRLARRGITYGDRPDLRGESAGPPSAGCGLLFMGYGRGIFSFELWQQTAEDETFLRNGTGVDPLIAGNPRPFPQEWPCPDAPELVRRAPFFGCTKLLGGEYFFTPSLTYLTDLAHTGPKESGE